MRIKLRQLEAFSLYKFYRYQKNDIRYEMFQFYKKHKIDVQDILFEFWIQYLEQFGEYKRKKIDGSIYVFKFNEEECKRLLVFTDKINNSHLHKLLKHKKYTDDYIKNLQNALNIIDRELKEINKIDEKLEEILFR